MVGALIIGSVRNILNLLHVSVYFQNIIVGVIIIAVVAFSMLMKARREQRTAQFKPADEMKKDTADLHISYRHHSSLAMKLMRWQVIQVLRCS